LGKRLLRIYSAELEEKWANHKGGITHLVMRNRATFVGRLTLLENGIIFLKDLMGKMHKFPISETEEVVFDTESTY
jgi:hypothetical protein